MNVILRNANLLGQLFPCSYIGVRVVFKPFLEDILLTLIVNSSDFPGFFLWYA